MIKKNVLNPGYFEYLGMVETVGLIDKLAKACECHWAQLFTYLTQEQRDLLIESKGGYITDAQAYELLFHIMKQMQFKAKNAIN